MAEAGAHPDAGEFKLPSVSGTLSSSVGHAILQRIRFYINPRHDVRVEGACPASAGHFRLG